MIRLVTVTAKKNQDAIRIKFIKDEHKNLPRNDEIRITTATIACV
jgi:hypothetical protein